MFIDLDRDLAEGAQIIIDVENIGKLSFCEQENLSLKLGLDCKGGRSS